MFEPGKTPERDHSSESLSSYSIGCLCGKISSWKLCAWGPIQFYAIPDSNPIEFQTTVIDYEAFFGSCARKLSNLCFLKS